jgi:hypothetical protein
MSLLLVYAAHLKPRDPAAVGGLDQRTSSEPAVDRGLDPVREQLLGPRRSGAHGWFDAGSSSPEQQGGYNREPS